ncbi:MULTISPECIES: symmetrical bis(5'-nucleosyl)-tetraphosphatase [Rheinheimera]|uniref:bis(5'-nucleosyl)-tetraphosphatase (symmetrical) n=1 Tax=Rheinheimera marina TaxID=1774958 RepID=A0ABV9JPA6_9GAMM
MARYVIGDIQGCLPQLKQLLARLQFNSAQDELWFCGDLVARGPESLQTLRFIKALGPQHKVVLGNHDLHLLACAYGVATAKASDQIDQVLQAPDRDELLDWLRYQPLMHYEPQEQLLLVHAGLAPGWSVATALQACAKVEQLLRQSPMQLFLHMYGNEPTLWHQATTDAERWRFTVNSCTRMRYCQHNGALELKEKRPPTEVPQLRPWYEFWQEVPHPQIFFGHWASLMGLSPVKGIHALDTGCVWGNSLTAYCIESGQRYSV